METFYLYCAIVAGALMFGQLVLAALGVGGHSDLEDMHGFEDVSDGDGHHGGHGGGDAWFAGMLSFRALTAAITVFGLIGLGAGKRFAPTTSLILASIAGFGVMYLVAWLMRSLYALRADGTVQIEGAVGQPGSVYLTIPGGKAGPGKVTLKLQGRSVECQAVTAGDELRTGTPVIVVDVVSPETVEVIQGA